uniref:(northern house mosquito) hypothetical protein n=1 Tax=Culex pipiens TaxID=7175 RepID=A0A8D8AB61_CULPI
MQSMALTCGCWPISWLDSHVFFKLLLLIKLSVCWSSVCSSWSEPVENLRPGAGSDPLGVRIVQPVEATVDWMIEGLDAHSSGIVSVQMLRSAVSLSVHWPPLEP